MVGRRIKVTDHNLEEIKRLRSKGLSYKKIGQKLGLPPSTVKYYCNYERERELRKKYSQKIPKKKKREYLREYMKRRYHEDKDFKKRLQELQREYWKRIQERNSQIKAKRVRCPYCNSEWETRNGRVPGFCRRCRRLLVKYEVLE